MIDNFNKSINYFLYSFFKLFDAQIKNIIIENNIVHGVVEWKDEDGEQEIQYEIIKNIDYLQMSDVIEILFQENIVDGDKIKISKKQMIKKMNDIGIDSSILESLLNIRIPRIDNRCIVDYFFLHF